MVSFNMCYMLKWPYSIRVYMLASCSFKLFICLHYVVLSLNGLISICVIRVNMTQTPVSIQL